MKNELHNIDDLFAKARNSEVKITLEQVRETLENHRPKTNAIDWSRLILLFGAAFLSTFLLIWSISNYQNDKLPLPIQNKELITEKQNKKPVEIPKEEITLAQINNKDNKTKAKKPIINGKSKRIKPKKLIQNLSPIVPISPKTFFYVYSEEALALMAKTAANLLAEEKKHVNPPEKDSFIFEMPQFETFSLNDKKLKEKKSEIHFMKRLANKESIRLLAYKKDGQKKLVLDKYNSVFEVIKSINLSSIIQNRNSKLVAAKIFNDRLLIISEELSNKKKKIQYTGYLIDYYSMKAIATKKLVNLAVSKPQTAINIQISANEKFLLLNPLPQKSSPIAIRNNLNRSSSRKERGATKKIMPMDFSFGKRASPQGIQRESKFFVFDENLKSFNKIKQPIMTRFETAIDDKGGVLIWKPKMERANFVSLPKTYVEHYILYRFEKDETYSKVLTTSSFDGLEETIMESIDEVESAPDTTNELQLDNLKMVLSPKGNPVLYTYLRDKGALQYLSFSSDLEPQQQAVYELSPNLDSKRQGEFIQSYEIDEVFFDKQSNFYVLSSSYTQDYLPLVGKDPPSQNQDFLDKKQVPFYPSYAIYFHKFDANGKPLMNAKIDHNNSSNDKENNSYSYLYKDQNFSLVYSDQLQISSTEGLKKTKKDNKEMLHLVGIKAPKEIIRYDGDKNKNLAAYQPLYYFQDKEQTFALLKGKKDFKIVLLYYGKPLDRKAEMNNLD